MSRSYEVLTEEHLEERAEQEARSMLGVSAREARAMIRRGELRGTLAEAELTALFDLIRASARSRRGALVS